MNEPLPRAHIVPPGVSSDERTWAMLAHLLPLVATSVPFGNILAPLIIWLVKKDEMPFVDDQARESLNFQITLTIAALICIPLIFVCVGILLLFGLMVFEIVVIIQAAIAVSRDERYRYPCTLRLVR